MMTTRKWSLLFLALTLALLAPSGADAYLLQTRDIVFLVRVGTNRDGTPAFRVATNSDYGAERIFNLASNSTALERTASYYRYVQQVKAQSLMEDAGRYGLSASDRQLAGQLLETEPVYIELKEGGGGAFNDWKGSFTVRSPNGGGAYPIQTPRVVMPLGSSVVTGGDTALLEQTLVHEIGHGGMCKCYGTRDLPDSPYLQQSHSGGSLTDPQLAIIEGWAEFIGAYFTNRLTIANDPKNALSNNLYAYNADGSPKSARDLLRTEGWVASALWMIAAKSGIRDSLQKMTAVMVRTKPQSFQALLEGFARMYPSDAPALQRVIAQASHGQIYGGAGQGPGGDGGALSQYQTTLDRYLRLRYAYLANDGYYDAERQRVGRAAQQEAQNMRALAERIRQQVASGRGAGDAMARLNQLTRTYDNLYREVRTRLDRTPWYSRQERGRLEAEAQAVGEILDLQYRLTSSLEQAPVYSRDSGQRYYPNAPVDSKTAYKNLVDSLRSGDRGAAASAMEAYQDSASRPPRPAK